MSELAQSLSSSSELMFDGNEAEPFDLLNENALSASLELTREPSMLNESLPEQIVRLLKNGSAPFVKSAIRELRTVLEGDTASSTAVARLVVTQEIDCLMVTLAANFSRGDEATTSVDLLECLRMMLELAPSMAQRLLESPDLSIFLTLTGGSAEQAACCDLILGALALEPGLIPRLDVTHAKVVMDLMASFPLRPTYAPAMQEAVFGFLAVQKQGHYTGVIKTALDILFLLCSIQPPLPIQATNLCLVVSALETLVEHQATQQWDERHACYHASHGP